MTGTLVNVLAIITGSILGLVFKERFPENIEKIIKQGLGLSILLIGLDMALQTENILIITFSLVIGGIIGELVAVEKRLYQLGNIIKEKTRTNNVLFVKGFVQASLIYCVGAMAIMGAIQDGLNSDPTILFNKSVLDGTLSIALSASMGLGVIFSAVPVLIYQGVITLLAFQAQFLLSDVIINEMTAAGGLLILGIGLNILGITDIKIGNFIPALFMAIILVLLF